MSYVTYQGKQVPREHFRVFVYNEKNEPKLANSYDEYLELTGSGLWFDEKAAITQKPKRVRPSRAKPKQVTNANS